MIDEEILDSIHINLHAVRLVPNYKPSIFEQKIAKLIVDKYKDTCHECKTVSEKPSELSQDNKNFLEKLGSVFK